MALPVFKSDDQASMLMQTRWAAILDPIVGNPCTNPSLLTGVKLINGATVINHGLGQKMQGWKIVDIDGAATIYRSAPISALTLTLISSAAVTVSLEVF